MIFADFKASSLIDLFLLNELGIAKTNQKKFKIELIDNGRATFHNEHNQCFCSGSWSFSEDFYSVIKIKNSAPVIILEEDLKSAVGCNMIGDPIDLLNADPDVDVNSIADKIDSMKIVNFSVGNPDNVLKTIGYYCVFRAINDAHDTDGFLAVTELSIIGLDENLINLPIYYQLIGEGYTLYSSGMYELAFFIIFTAIENFVNYKFDDDDSRERLTVKLSKVIKSQFENNFTEVPKDNKLINLIKSMFGSFIEERNKIAHGLEREKLTKDKCFDMLIVALVLIVALERDTYTLKEIKDLVC